jgi:hypothetical protein
MGYRSDVAFVIRNKPSPENAPTDSVALIVPQFEEIENAFDYVYRPPNNPVAGERTDYFYYATGVKWYEGYDVVDAVTSFLRCLNDEDYYYIVIGEELNDILIMGSYYYNQFDMAMERRIVFDEE